MPRGLRTPRASADIASAGSGAEACSPSPAPKRRIHVKSADKTDSIDVDTPDWKAENRCSGTSASSSASLSAAGSAKSTAVNGAGQPSLPQRKRLLSEDRQKQKSARPPPEVVLLASEHKALPKEPKPTARPRKWRRLSLAEDHAKDLPAKGKKKWQRLVPAKGKAKEAPAEEATPKKAEQKEAETHGAPAAAAKSTESEGCTAGMRRGRKVMLHGLTKATHLNGRIARLGAFVEKTGRWSIKLDDETESKTVLPRNIKFVGNAKKESSHLSRKYRKSMGRGDAAEHDVITSAATDVEKDASKKETPKKHREKVIAKRCVGKHARDAEENCEDKVVAEMTPTAASTSATLQEEQPSQKSLLAAFSRAAASNAPAEGLDKIDNASSHQAAAVAETLEDGSCSSKKSGFWGRKRRKRLGMGDAAENDVATCAATDAEKDIGKKEPAKKHREKVIAKRCAGKQNKIAEENCEEQSSKNNLWAAFNRTASTRALTIDLEDVSAAAISDVVSNDGQQGIAAGEIASAAMNTVEDKAPEKADDFKERKTPDVVKKKTSIITLRSLRRKRRTVEDEDLEELQPVDEVHPEDMMVHPEDMILPAEDVEVAKEPGDDFKDPLASQGGNENEVGERGRDGDEGACGVGGKDGSKCESKAGNKIEKKDAHGKEQPSQNSLQAAFSRGAGPSLVEKLEQASSSTAGDDTAMCGQNQESEGGGEVSNAAVKGSNAESSGTAAVETQDNNMSKQALKRKRSVASMLHQQKCVSKPEATSEGAAPDNTETDVKSAAGCSQQAKDTIDEHLEKMCEELTMLQANDVLQAVVTPHAACCRLLTRGAAQPDIKADASCSEAVSGKASLSIHQRAELFSIDEEVLPLMVQENYLQACTEDQRKDDALASDLLSCAAAADSMAWGDVLSCVSLASGGDCDLFAASLLLAAVVPSAQASGKLSRARQPAAAPVHPMHRASIGELSRLHGFPKTYVSGEFHSWRRRAAAKTRDDPRRAQRAFSAHFQRAVKSICAAPDQMEELEEADNDDDDAEELGEDADTVATPVRKRRANAEESAEKVPSACTEESSIDDQLSRRRRKLTEEKEHILKVNASILPALKKGPQDSRSRKELRRLDQLTKEMLTPLWDRGLERSLADSLNATFQTQADSRGEFAAQAIAFLEELLLRHHEAVMQELAEVAEEEDKLWLDGWQEAWLDEDDSLEEEAYDM